MRNKREILIRCVGISGQVKNKVQYLAPYIAFNQERMNRIGFVIQDPEADAKRRAWEYFEEPQGPCDVE